MIDSDFEVTASVNISAPKRDTWQVISRTETLNIAIHFVRKTLLLDGEMKILKTQLNIIMEFVSQDCFVNWNENNGYNLLIKNGDETYAKVSWSVKSLGELNSELTICVSLFTDIILGRYPNFIREIICKMLLLPKLNDYLKSVTNGFKYYLETGKKVRKNQFGYNFIFQRNSNYFNFCFESDDSFHVI